MRIRLAVFMLVVFATAGCSTMDVKPVSGLDNAHRTALLYEKFIKGESPDIAQLNLFFSKMPKGGDLHHHYSGSIYAETYLDWVKNAGYWIDKKTLKINKMKTSDGLSVDELRENKELYRKLLTLWSDKDYQNHCHLQLPPDSNFFNTFGYFGPISDNYDEGLMILRERAIKENVAYIESMLSSVGYSYPDDSFDKKIGENISLDETSLLLDHLLSEIDRDPGFKEKVNGFVKNLKTVHQGVDDDKFMMRYQTYATRNGSPSKVFSSLYSAFKAAEISELLVGVNFVGPENGVVAIADYKLHMQMFAHLRKKFPNVNVALHAGELALGMVRPKNLTFHISQAIGVAGAQRIGHGVDLPYEQDAMDLLRRISKTSAIEINLTSNEFILGVKGRSHPYLIYSAYDVPIVICTDDSGVSRNNLTGEYVLLAKRYKPSYEMVKKYVYNTAEYSFLPEREKNLLRESLDLRFEKFEAEMAKYSAILSL